MSSTGYWFVGTAAPETIARLRKDLPAASFAPLPEDADVTWWRTMDQATLLAPPDPRYTYPGPSEAARRFVETLDELRPDPESRYACLRALEETPPAEIFHLGIRKGDPVAALFYGLGFADAARLPGRFGCFLLKPDDVRTSLAAIDGLPGQPSFAARTSAWLSAVSDEPDLDPHTLLDGPLRVLRLARERQVGAIGFMEWY